MFATIYYPNVWLWQWQNDFIEAVAGSRPSNLWPMETNHYVVCQFTNAFRPRPKSVGANRAAKPKPSDNLSSAANLSDAVPK